MKKFKALLERPWFAYTFAACAAVILYMMLNNYSVFSNAFSAIWKFLSPIVIGIVVAYLLNPISQFFERKVFFKMKKDSARHTASVILTAVCFVLIIGLLLIALIPSLIQSVSKLVSNFPAYTEKLEGLLLNLTGFAEKFNIGIDLSNISELIDSGMEKIMALLKDNTDTIMEKVSSVGTSISNFFIGILFGFCFLIAKKQLLSFLSKIREATMSEKRIERHNELLLRCHKIFIRYFGCTIVDALIVGTLTLIFLLIMRMPYAPLIAIIVAITNIIPTFGPVIGGAMGIFFLVLDKPINALWFLVFICIIQALDGTVIKTKLFSGSLGIPGVWTMILIILGGKVAGILGILLAIPFAAIFVIIYNETIVPKLEKMKKRQNA